MRPTPTTPPAPDTTPVPLDEIREAITHYRSRITPSICSAPRCANVQPCPRHAVTKRRAERALTRLKNACDEVLRAMSAMPEELQFPDFYAEPLFRAAAAIEHEAGWRLYGVRHGTGKTAARLRQAQTAQADARRSLESRIGQLFEVHGWKMTTYDPRRYPEPRGGEGKRGGHLARVLLGAYRLARIAPPADLQPVLARLRREAVARAKGRTKLRKYIGDPRRFLREVK